MHAKQTHWVHSVLFTSKASIVTPPTLPLIHSQANKTIRFHLLAWYIYRTIFGNKESDYHDIYIHFKQFKPEVMVLRHLTGIQCWIFLRSIRLLGYVFLLFLHFQINKAKSTISETVCVVYITTAVNPIQYVFNVTDIKSHAIASISFQWQHKPSVCVCIISREWKKKGKKLRHQFQKRKTIYCIYRHSQNLTVRFNLNTECQKRKQNMKTPKPYSPIHMPNSGNKCEI